MLHFLISQVCPPPSTVMTVKHMLASVAGSQRRVREGMHTQYMRQFDNTYWRIMGTGGRQTMKNNQILYILKEPSR